MRLFDEKSDLKLRIQFAVTFTVFFAGSWCLSQKRGNIFWLCLSQATYFRHLAIWLFLGIFIFLLLYLVGKRYNKIEGKVTLFLLILCLLNILDFGIRSLFGPISEWPIAVLINWSLITLLYPGIALFTALKVPRPGNLIKIAMKICIAPILLIAFYAIPPGFAILEIEKPIKTGKQASVHLILFDMLSPEFIFSENEIKPIYKNFKSFSKECDIYLNAFSPSGTTGQTIARLTTGLDFEYVGYHLHSWIVQKGNSSEKREISSYKTIFSIANKNNYNVFLRAFALPYLNNFGEHVQSGKIYPYDTLWKVGMHSLIWPILNPGGVQHQETTNKILGNYILRLQNHPQNTFFFTHWNIPHYPFIYDDDGQMYSRTMLIKNLIKKPDPKIDYQNQLKGTDKIFGQIVEALKRSGTYDESLIIVTSDHNIDGYGFNMKHIPLFVKRPYQQSSRKIKSTVTTFSLLNFVEYFMNEGQCENSIFENSYKSIS
jgi:hypothetical protein